jgi:16S rRNA (guanine527-N7)-methyltransferase
MLSLCGNMADQDTLFLALKGQIDTAELSEISDEYKIININKLKVPQILGERHLIVIGKNNG